MSTLYNTRAKPASLYQPGQYYDASKGMTVTQFEDPRDVAKACVVESGFLRDPGAFAKAIVVANFSGQDLIFACDKPKRVNRNLPFVRENEAELDAFAVPNGCSSHFNVPPSCFILSVKQKVLTENGRDQYESRQGFEFSSLRDKVVTYNEGDENGVITACTANGHLGGYTYIKNDTDRPISVKVTKTTTAYVQSPDELIESRQSRVPDGGGQVVHKQVIESGGMWHVKNTRIGWIVRALQTEQENDDNPLVSAGMGIPSNDSYVELGNASARNGDFVIAFADASRNGAIRLKTYLASEIKPVDSDISVTGPNCS